MLKIDLIAGARPNFIKIAPIIKAIKKAQLNGKKIGFRLVHTGQHYDKNMSANFFDQLKIPHPDVNFEAGGGTQSEQTSTIMLKYEALLKEGSPDFCLVVGDVTSTMACTIVAKKMKIKVLHVEAGIRSGDISMPEEINRIVTDSLSDYFYTTSENAGKNLLRSGVPKEKIIFVGNTMIDTLLSNKNKFKKPSFWVDLNLVRKRYFILTLHRPSNVDSGKLLEGFIEEVTANSNGYPVLFPVHPRLKKRIHNLEKIFKNLCVFEPLSYFEFNYLVENSLAVLTDSGGVTEETTVMNIPCITIRDSTERPETVSMGTNELIGTQKKNIGPALKKILSGNWKKGEVPPMWDGKSSCRIISHILSI